MIRQTIIIFLIILGWTAFLGAIAVSAQADTLIIIEAPVPVMTDAQIEQWDRDFYQRIMPNFEAYAQHLMEENRRDLRRMKEVH